MGRGTMIGLLLGAAVLCITSAGKLDTSYLLPGSSIRIDRAALGQTRFCALTFDDGPDSAYTQQVQRILDQQGVHATFFVVGARAARYPQQIRALRAAGHQIENHSWSHPDFTSLSDARRRTELSRTTAELRKLGVQPRYFRPPFGAFNRATLKVSRELGLEPLLWTVDPKDWMLPGAATIVSRVCDGCTSGAVVLLHSTNSQTVEALPAILERLRGEGYRFVTLDEWQALASGRPLPVLPALPRGAPPSFREQVPGESPSLPEAPSPPAPLLAQRADPEWVESMSADFYAPFDGEIPAGGVPTADEAPTESDAAGEPSAESSVEPGAAAGGESGLDLPWSVQRGAAVHGSVVRSSRNLLAAFGLLREPVLHVAAALPPVEPVPVGPALRVYGNFAWPDEAAGILDTQRSGPVRRVR